MAPACLAFLDFQTAFPLESVAATNVSVGRDVTSPGTCSTLENGARAPLGASARDSSAAVANSET